MIVNIPVRTATWEPNYKKLQYKVKYVDSLGVKKVLKPEDALEIRFVYDSVEVRMVSKVNLTLCFLCIRSIWGKRMDFNTKYSEKHAHKRTDDVEETIHKVIASSHT